MFGNKHTEHGLRCRLADPYADTSGMSLDYLKDEASKSFFVSMGCVFFGGIACYFMVFTACTGEWMLAILLLLACVAIAVVAVREAHRSVKLFIAANLRSNF